MEYSSGNRPIVQKLREDLERSSPASLPSAQKAHEDLEGLSSNSFPPAQEPNQVLEHSSPDNIPPIYEPDQYDSTIPHVPSDDSPVENLVACRKGRKKLTKNKLSFNQLLFSENDIGVAVPFSRNPLTALRECLDSLPKIQAEEDTISSDDDTNQVDNSSFNDSGLEVSTHDPITEDESEVIETDNDPDFLPSDNIFSSDDNESDNEALSEIINKVIVGANDKNVKTKLSKKPENLDSKESEKDGSETVEQKNDESEELVQEGTQQDLEQNDLGQCSQEVTNENMSIKKRDDGHKQHICFYCKEIVWKPPRHFQRKHSNESEVQKALAYRSGSKERRQQWQAIICRGDYEHNLKVLKTK